MVSGATEVEALDETEGNKALVRRFADEVLTGGGHGIDHYVAGDLQRHRPAAEDGVAAFGAHLRTREYLEVHRLIGQGNFVVLYSHVRSAADELALFDIFRVDDGLIVEHWDVAETIGPPETWNNQGKF